MQVIPFVLILLYSSRRIKKIRRWQLDLQIECQAESDLPKLKGTSSWADEMKWEFLRIHRFVFKMSRVIPELLVKTGRPSSNYQYRTSWFRAVWLVSVLVHQCSHWIAGIQTSEKLSGADECNGAGSGFRAGQFVCVRCDGEHSRRRGSWRCVKSNFS